jgi:dolichol-phosphate mannosyltransferase
MTYRARQYGAAITEVPIKFVDREAGESKMSSFIVFEALGLVTFWGLGRIVHGAKRLLSGSRREPAGAARTPTDTEDPVRSV